MNEFVRSLSVFQYQIGDWEVDPVSRRIRRAGVVASLSPTGMDVLVHFASRPGLTITHEELLAAHWRGAISSTNAVHKTISEIRHALGNGDSLRYIETIPKRGYRLIVPVERIQSAAAGGSAGSGASIRELQPDHAVAQPNGAAVNGDAADRSAAVAEVSRLPTRSVRWMAGMMVAAVLAVLAGVAAFRYAPIQDQTGSQEPSGGTQPAAHTIAVTPFDTSTDASDITYIGTGLAAEIAYRLARLPNSSVQRAQPADVIEIGRSLAVDHVLRGDIRLTGDRLGVRVELLATRDASVLYSREFDEPLTQLRSLQDRITSEVLDALVINLDPDRRADMLKGGTDDPNAYLLQLEAKYVMGQPGRENQEKAAALFRQVIAYDPKYADPYSCLAMTLSGLARFQSVEVHTDIARQLEALAIQASSQAPESGADHAVLYELAEMKGDNFAREAALRELIKTADSPVRRYLALEDLYGGLLERGGLFVDAKQYKWKFWSTRNAGPHGQEKLVLRELVNTSLWLRGPDVALPSYLGPVDSALSNGQTPPIDWLSPAVALLSRFGRLEEARRYLEVMRKADTAGLYFEHANMVYRVFAESLDRESPGYREWLERAPSRLSAGQIAFMLGDIDTGVTMFSQLNAFEIGILQQSRWLIEYQIPAAVRADPRYQSLLDGLQMGELWQRQLESGVRELTPFTGIHLASDAPEKVVVGNWRYGI